MIYIPFQNLGVLMRSLRSNIPEFFIVAIAILAIL